MVPKYFLCLVNDYFNRSKMRLDYQNFLWLFLIMPYIPKMPYIRTLIGEQ